MSASASQCDVILLMLRDGGPVSTRDLSHFSGSLAVHSRISELRARGYEIEHSRSALRQSDGRKRMVSVYRLVDKQAAA